jgi:hypothetical protein
MNTPVIAVIIAVALIAGSALAIMNKASQSGYQALCAQHFHIAGSLLGRLPDYGCRLEIPDG